MGDTEELIRADGPDPAFTDMPGSAPKTKNNTFIPSDGEITAPTQAPCFVVGIGASAGGHEPIEHIFTTVPADCNLSFVVIMHIPAEGPSLLADIIRRYTSMEVLTAEEGMPLRPNTVHVIPPGVVLTVKERRLRLDTSEVSRREHHPIDHFFTSLAADIGARSIAVILSGFGLDGSEGVKRIKEGGGVILVQDPGTAINPSMPQNVIATGMADMVLPAEVISERIAEIARGHCPLLPQACLTTTIDEELHALFAILKARTGHDFSSYKKNTILRRIERRMTVKEAGGIRKYLAILGENPKEAQALCQDFLIGVTSFFRDPEAFEFLQSEIIPRLFANRDAEEPVRIWHACCATGEEAYSVAILIQEYLEKENLQTRVQIFATDIDEGAVAQARAGLYPDDIGPEVGEERLNRFFTRFNGRWQVAKRLREMIVFAHHSIIKDPPFSRLDLLVCRNFLIYLDPDMQKRLISLFNMALRPGKFLFLGASESVGRNSELFSFVDKKWKIYRRLESVRREEAFFPFTPPVRKFIRHVSSKRAAEAGEPSPGVVADRLLVERYAPPSMIVNEKYEVLHFSAKTGRFMEVPVGEPTRDILRMAREELRPALRAAIYKAFTDQKQVAFRGVKIADRTGEEAVNVLVEPLPADPAYGKLAMVILEPAPSPALPLVSTGGDAHLGDETSKEMLIRQLEEQLRITHEQLQATSEQLETSSEGFLSANEELMSINEEFQSTNEELQSTNEELETSKEELQALNEELVTVNSELQGKVEELNQSNSDTENLFTSSGIAAIFLDRGLIIKRFSPAMAAIFNLIPADLGRPFRYLAGTIDWTDLSRDALVVLEKLEPIEREVSAIEDGRCFIMRVLPYRTPGGGVDGIVVTLIDITELKRAEDSIRSTALFPEENPSAILRVSRDGTLLYANRSAFPLLAMWQCQTNSEAPEFLRRELKGVLENGKIVELEARLGESLFSFMLVPIPDRGYVNIYGHDITEQKQAEEALHESEERFRTLANSIPQLCWMAKACGEIFWYNDRWFDYTGTTLEQMEGWGWQSVHDPEVLPHVLERWQVSISTGEPFDMVFPLRGSDGVFRQFLTRVMPVRDQDGNIVRWCGTNTDITERKQAEETHARLAAIVESSDDAIIAKDLNGLILSWNAGAERLFGYRADEVIGKSITILTPPELQGEEERILRKLSSGERIEHFETVRLTRDGQRVAVSVSESPIRDSQGNIIGASKIARDITQSKQAEESLRQAKEEWERTFDSVPDMITILDNDHRILRVNEAMARRLGRKPEECEGLPCYEAVHGTDFAPSFCPHARTIADYREHVEEVHTERLGGDFLVTTTPLHDKRGLMIGSVHVAHDITERKRAEVERQISVEFLRMVNESQTSTDLIRAATYFFHEKSGCEAVGIRLKDGDDYPYFETHGFPEEFVFLENHLCNYDESGEIIRDSKDNPVMDCMCGNVVCGRFDPTRPFFTDYGSFWSNGTSELLASSSDTDRLARTRNRCNGEGYESVALIPLRIGEERLGLLQFNDRQKGRFSPATIALWERLSGYLSVALTKFKAEEAIARRNTLLAGINSILKDALTSKTEEEHAEFCLKVAEELTGSHSGFIGEIGADGMLHDIAISENGWDICAMYDRAGNRRPPGNFHIRGVYGRVLLDGKSFYTNDPCSHPDSIGVPEGHPPLSAFLGVPLKSSGKTVGMIAVANRDGGYRAEELESLEALAPAIVEAFQRYRAEQELEIARLMALQDKNRLEAVMEALPVGVSIHDSTGGHIHANRAFEKVWGGSRPLPRSFEDYVDYKAWWVETGLPVLPEEWAAARALQNDESLVGQLLRIERFDGSRAYIHNSAAPIHDTDGRIVGCAVAIMDITDQIEAEEALRSSYQRTDLMAEAISQLLASDSPQKVVNSLCRRVMDVLDCQAFFNFLVDEKAGRLHLNACAGIPEEEVGKLEWLDYGVAVCGCAARDASRIVAEDIPNTPDQRTELVKSYGIRAYACHPLMAQGRVLGTLSFGTRNREVFTEAELSLMKTVADHVAIAMERKLAEEDLKLAREAAEAASLAKSQFLANMSHELRTPMTGVLGMLEFTLNTTLDAKQQDFIETANKSARTLLRILNDILDLAKVEAGKLSLEVKPFVLRECVVGAVDILVPEARRKGLVLKCTMADDLPKTVVGDQVRLLQVLTNLLGNAVKYTERGQVNITVTSGSQAQAGKKEIIFNVADSGIGIPANKKEMIFQSFTQVDESHTRKFGGVGLGLAISRELVERMGGRFPVRAKKGWGVPSPLPSPSEMTKQRAIWQASLWNRCQWQVSLFPLWREKSRVYSLPKMIRSPER
jgi:two-component system, chemotaxis family, CheB/CheR fusion protein